MSFLPTLCHDRMIASNHHTVWYTQFCFELNLWNHRSPSIFIPLSLLSPPASISRTWGRSVLRANRDARTQPAGPAVWYKWKARLEGCEELDYLQRQWRSTFLGEWLPWWWKYLYVNKVLILNHRNVDWGHFEDIEMLYMESPLLDCRSLPLRMTTWKAGILDLTISMKSLSPRVAFGKDDRPKVSGNSPEPANWLLTYAPEIT